MLRQMTAEDAGQQLFTEGSKIMESKKISKLKRAAVAGRSFIRRGGEGL